MVSGIITKVSENGNLTKELFDDKEKAIKSIDPKSILAAVSYRNGNEEFYLTDDTEIFITLDNPIVTSEDTEDILDGSEN